jgi:hypothetical protein
MKRKRKEEDEMNAQGPFAGLLNQNLAFCIVDDRKAFKSGLGEFVRISWI